jgi:hypothetical protein
MIIAYFLKTRNDYSVDIIIFEQIGEIDFGNTEN